MDDGHTDSLPAVATKPILYRNGKFASKKLALLTKTQIAAMLGMSDDWVRAKLIPALRGVNIMPVPVDGRDYWTVQQIEDGLDMLREARR